MVPAAFSEIILPLLPLKKIPNNKQQTAKTKRWLIRLLAAHAGNKGGGTQLRSIADVSR